jgi:hypothetical protein
MGVWYQKFSKGLRGDDHGRDSVVLPIHERRVLAHVVAGGGIHDATEIPVQRAVEEEGLSQSYGYRDNELPVRDQRKDFFDHALGPLDCTALSARGTKTSRAARESHQFFFLLVAGGIDAADSDEPEM